LGTSREQEDDRMETSSLIGFGLTIGCLVVFMAVSWAQLGRARKVAAGKITVGNRPPGSTVADPDDDPEPARRQDDRADDATGA